MSKFLAELRRRNVFRVAAAYLVVGWLVMQVISVIASAAALPDWADSMALILLLAGLPVALFIAWAFELTPEGLKKTGTIEEAPSLRLLGASDWVLIASVLIVVAVVAYQSFTSPQTAAPAATERVVGPATPAISDASIAVLPFVDLSPGGDQSYFSDGISEEILNVLVRVRGLEVTSRTSAFQYRGDAFSIPEIGQRLGVRHVLEGSVRRSGNTVRITAQLIDANTDVHLWSQTYDRALTAENLFAIQDEIARAIVTALGDALGLDETASVTVSADTANLDAYDTFLQAREFFRNRSGENLPRAVELFEQVTREDPGFARAWAGLASTYAVYPGWVDDESRNWAQLAREAADQASQLDDSLALPYSVRALLTTEASDWAEALRQSDLAIERGPEEANSWYFRGTALLRAGYFAAAARDLEHCLEVDPAYEICRRFLSFAYLYGGRTDEAMTAFELSLMRNQQSSVGVFLPVYAAQGNLSATRVLLGYLAEFGDWRNEIEDRWLTDPGYPLEDYRADMFNAYRQHFGAEYEPDQNDTWTWFDTVWNPYRPERLRPELIDADRAERHAIIERKQLPAFWRERGFPPQCRPVGSNDFECD
ncbi:hypothetical protein [uncultured Maricaulis sp.]|uniref:tetratricopeptide repeat protein n=1 Tax=uncultured Maricaulis sp. TaxID=174710 RepID=UPI0030DD1DB5|tara:strand:- start:14539 stop:16332 length:1794 start_codon:yes stop_codon:yes gene_type:complete